MRTGNRYGRVCRTLAVVLCGLLLCLSIGTAQGRYRYKSQSEDGQVDFYLPQTEQLQIGSEKTDASGDLLPLSTWTTNGAGVASLAFCVSNGTSEAYAEDAMSFHIRLIASLGLQKAENLTVTLQYEGRTYIGTAAAIPEGSGRYETFGPGWTFSFRDASGAEAAWTLAGGTLSKANFTLTVEGEAQYDSLLQIEVTGR